MLPLYLTQLLPQTVDDTVAYSLRNGNNLVQFYPRTDKFGSHYCLTV